MRTLLHVSDLQVGKPFRPWAAEALFRFAAELHPDVVVVAGDLTQRAKAREFRIAASLLSRFGDVPVVVTPGNHDVPLYRIWERLVSPYRNWKRFIASRLDSVTKVPGGTLVALNSSCPRGAIVAGRIARRQLDFAAAAFEQAPTSDVRVVVTHHHFVPAPHGEGGRTLPNADSVLEAFEGMGVDAVLGGHVHQTHLHTSTDLSPHRAGLPLIACGTTTSRRGRGVEAGLNSLNVLRFREGEIEVIPHTLRSETGDFESEKSIVFPSGRRARGSRAPAGGARP